MFSKNMPNTKKDNSRSETSPSPDEILIIYSEAIGSDMINQAETITNIKGLLTPIRKLYEGRINISSANERNPDKAQYIYILKNLPKKIKFVMLNSRNFDNSRSKLYQKLMNDLVDEINDELIGLDAASKIEPVVLLEGPLSDSQ